MGQFSLVVASADDLAEFSGSVTPSFVTEESAPAIHYVPTGTGNLRWNTPGTALDFDLYARWKIVGHTSVTGRYHGPCVRWDGNSDGPSYLIASGGATNRRSLYKIPADVEIANFTLTGVTDTYHWIRLKIVGSNLYGKAWLGAVEDEPEAWDLTASDSAYASAGYCGFHGEQMTNSPPTYFTHLYLGTGGDPAPIGGGGGSSRRRSSLIWTPF